MTVPYCILQFYRAAALKHWWIVKVLLGSGLTSKTVISTGMTVPALSCVAALYSLQKPMMLTPCT